MKKHLWKILEAEGYEKITGAVSFGVELINQDKNASSMNSFRSNEEVVMILDKHPESHQA